MAKQMNFIGMEGHLVADPESRTVGQSTVCNFRMATNNGKRKVNGTEVDDTTFINYEVWGKSAEAFQKFATKGTGIWVNGSLRNNPEDVTIQLQDGSTKPRKIAHYKVRVTNWGFLPGNNNGGNGNGQAQQTNGNGQAQQSAASGNGGNAQAGPAPASNDPYSAGSPDDFTIIDDDQDLPF